MTARRDTSRIRPRARVHASALQPAPRRRRAAHHGPRGGRRRTTHTRSSLPVTLALLALLAVVATVAAAGWWVFSRPVDLVIAATPVDATIVSCETTATGELTLGELAPGVFEVSITRQGFEPLTTTVEARRFAPNTYSFELIPQPQCFSLAVEPSESRYCVTSEDGEVACEGTGAAETTLPSGSYTLTVSAEGRNTYERDFFIDTETSFTVWLDPDGQLVQTRGIVPCSGAPKGVHVTPDGTEAWATILNGPPSIEIFDLSTLQRTGTVDLGEHGAVEITFSADGTRAFASQMETAKVFEIDVGSRAVLRELPTESAWTKVVALSPDESRVYAANWSGNDVSEIDRTSCQVVRRIRTSKTPRGLYATPDGTALYVAGFDRGDLQRVDLASGEITTVFTSGGAMRHLAGDPERGVLFASDMAKDLVWIHDMRTGQTREFTKTDAKPNTIALSPDGKVLFVSCRGANNPRSYYIPGPEWGTILLFDAHTGEPLDAIVGGNQCTALDVSGDGRTLVFSDFLDDRLRVYDVPDFETLKAGNGGRWKAHFEDLRKQ